LVGGRVWSGCILLRIGIVGWLLRTRWWTSGFWRHGVSSSHLFHLIGCLKP
jgi:hypothetical protein